MRLLILTQKVDKDDPVLGFFHRWLEEFSKLYESLIVICLQEGKHELPQNVKVLSLGKEKGQARFTYIKNFYQYIFKYQQEYDAVFVHMNPEYVILGGPFWRAWRKKIGLWYVHRAVNLRIWFGKIIANYIFTSVPESFRLKSQKVHYMGHGIDTKKFKYEPYDPNHKKLVAVGRITPIKHFEIAIDALSVLNSEDFGWRLEIIGGIGKLSDLKYKNNLHERIKELELNEYVRFVGSKQVSGEDFRGAFASLNMTPTGGMDKVVLESLASGCPVFTSNEAYKGILSEYAEQFIFEFCNAYDLAHKILDFARTTYKTTNIDNLSKKVREEYDVQSVVVKIASTLGLGYNGKL